MSTLYRDVIDIVVPQVVTEGAGVRLRRSIATLRLEHLDPFLLFDHFGSDDPSDYLAGFPMHPHRGIETVTYILEGEVTHADSLGNRGTIGPGDVQWMTSGRGILHEEMPRPRQGRMSGFQLWVNLPAELKMTRPRYQEIPSGLTPEVSRNDGARIRVIAGMVEGVTGAVTEIAADPTYLDIALPPATALSLTCERGHTVFAYIFEGEANFGSTTVGSPRLVLLGEGDRLAVGTARSSCRFLLVSGRPLHEPIARYGPFVMNTREEIEQALRDLRNGTFVQP